MKKVAKEKEFENYYIASQGKYQRLEQILVRIADGELKSCGILHLPPTARTKTLRSCIKKIKIKNYADPIRDITNTVGLRIVVYLDSEIKKTEDAVRRVFDVIEDLSVDKRKAATLNQVGYRSIHLMCSLGTRRQALPEYADISS